MTTTTHPTFSEAEGAVRAAMVASITDPAVQNDRTAELREQAIRELQESITPTTLPGELRAVAAAIDLIRRAGSPTPRSPFLQGLQGVPS